MNVTVDLASLSEGDRTAATRFLNTRVISPQWSASAPGQAANTVAEALRTGQTSAAISFDNRHDTSSFVRTLEGGARDATGSAQVVIRDIARQVADADAAANPGAIPIRSM